MLMKTSNLIFDATMCMKNNGVSDNRRKENQKQLHSSKTLYGFVRMSFGDPIPPLASDFDFLPAEFRNHCYSR